MKPKKLCIAIAVGSALIFGAVTAHAGGLTATATDVRTVVKAQPQKCGVGLNSDFVLKFYPSGRAFCIATTDDTIPATKAPDEIPPMPEPKPEPEPEPETKCNLGADCPGFDPINSPEPWVTNPDWWGPKINKFKWHAENGGEK